MKRLSFIVILAILLTGLILSRLSDNAISIANTNAQNSEATSTISKADNSSASTAITITMYAVADE